MLFTLFGLRSVEVILLSLSMILILSDGFWGKKLYAAMAAMGFAAVAIVRMCEKSLRIGIEFEKQCVA